MRLPRAAALLLTASCAAPPAPAPPPPPSAAPPPAPTSASTLVVTRDEGPPPQPPMAMRWTWDLPSFHGQPWAYRRFILGEDGAVTWETAEGEGDGDLDELLQAKPRPYKAPPLPCRGKVGPGLHRRLVEAAKRAMANGCAEKGRVDAATTTVAVTWEGVVKSCDLGRTGAGSVALEQAREEAVRQVCGEGRPAERR